jgi:hypothetical protein
MLQRPLTRSFLMHSRRQHTFDSPKISRLDRYTVEMSVGASGTTKPVHRNSTMMKACSWHSLFQNNWWQQTRKSLNEETVISEGELSPQDIPNWAAKFRSQYDETQLVMRLCFPPSPTFAIQNPPAQRF